MSTLVLLGPQRFRPTVRETVESLGAHGRVAVVTAGWQEREAEDDELREHLGREVSDLLLYHRYDDVLLRDRELAAALRERQSELRVIQQLYRIRLDASLKAVRQLMARQGPRRLLEDARRAAIRAVRSLDREHLRRLRKVHEAFDARWRPTERPAVARHRAQLQHIIEGSAALAIAGGNVLVLLGRMRLFGLDSLIGERPVVAWSAGAMALSERVVLFHDNPPQGAGNPEVLDAGLALSRGVVPLPHARRRLRLDDPSRVSLFARRFAPSICVVLDAGARLTRDGDHWVPGPGTLRLTRAGRVREIDRP